jgi:hypothetical protein
VRQRVATIVVDAGGVEPEAGPTGGGAVGLAQVNVPPPPPRRKKATINAAIPSTQSIGALPTIRRVGRVSCGSLAVLELARVCFTR